MNIKNIIICVINIIIFIIINIINKIINKFKKNIIFYIFTIFFIKIKSKLAIRGGSTSKYVAVFSHLMLHCSSS